MRDIPFFTTENGVASLVLSEIFYKKIAYIRIQSASDCASLLEECIVFCRAAGAEKVFATGHDFVANYPLFTDIIEMKCATDKIPDANGILIPVESSSLKCWCEIYNDRMRNVPNSATITSRNMEGLLGSSFFVYRDDLFLGIGKVSGNKIEALASVVSGAGREIVATLCMMIKESYVCVEVATANVPATRLYNSMLFEVSNKIASWYQVF